MMYCPECNSEYQEDILFCEDCSASLVLVLEKPQPLEEVEWVSLDNIRGDIYAEMVKEVLDNNDIPCYIKTAFMISAFGIKGAGIPGTKCTIFVPSDYYEEAAEILSQMMD